MRDKIAEIILNEPINDGNYASILADKILALFKECPAARIEDCPWGKDNVEFQKVMLKALPDISNIEVVEKCEYNDHMLCGANEGGTGDCYNPNMNLNCQDGGEITRPAEWGDIEISTKHVIATREGINDAEYIILKAKSGRLRVKGEKG